MAILRYSASICCVERQRVDAFGREPERLDQIRKQAHFLAAEFADEQVFLVALQLSLRETSKYVGFGEIGDLIEVRSVDVFPFQPAPFTVVNHLLH